LKNQKKIKEIAVYWIKNMMTTADELDLDEMLYPTIGDFSSDEYKDKEMVYITDEMRNYKPTYDDIWLTLKNNRTSR
jgi:hypothetical protein